MARFATRTAFFLFTFFALPAGAQSFGIGVGGVEAPYPLAAGTADFNSDVYVAGFYGRGTYLQGFIGTDQQPGVLGDSASVRLVGADLFTGGNPSVVRIPGDLPVRIFLPVRLGASYRYVDVKDPLVSRSRTGHIGEGTLGIGGGVGLDIPAALTAGLGSVFAEAAYVVSAGVLADFQRSEPEPLAVRAGTLSLGLRVINLAGSRLGASVGYTLRTSGRSGRLDTGGDFIEAITSSGGLTDYETMHLVRAGLAF